MTVDAFVVLPSVKNFQQDQLNYSRFPVFPGGIKNSRRFPVFPEYPWVANTVKEICCYTQNPSKTICHNIWNYNHTSYSYIITILANGKSLIVLLKIWTVQITFENQPDLFPWQEPLQSRNVKERVHLGSCTFRPINEHMRLMKRCKHMQPTISKGCAYTLGSQHTITCTPHQEILCQLYN